MCAITGSLQPLQLDGYATPEQNALGTRCLEVGHGCLVDSVRTRGTDSRTLGLRIWMSSMRRNSFTSPARGSGGYSCDHLLHFCARLSLKSCLMILRTGFRARQITQRVSCWLRVPSQQPSTPTVAVGTCPPLPSCFRTCPSPTPMG